jgi:hypothetical protein
MRLDPRIEVMRYIVQNVALLTEACVVCWFVNDPVSSAWLTAE